MNMALLVFGIVLILANIVAIIKTWKDRYIDGDLSKRKMTQLITTSLIFLVLLSAMIYFVIQSLPKTVTVTYDANNGTG